MIDILPPAIAVLIAIAFSFKAKAYLSRPGAPTVSAGREARVYRFRKLWIFLNGVLAIFLYCLCVWWSLFFSGKVTADNDLLVHTASWLLSLFTVAQLWHLFDRITYRLELTDYNIVVSSLFRRKRVKRHAIKKIRFIESHKSSVLVLHYGSGKIALRIDGFLQDFESIKAQLLGRDRNNWDVTSGRQTLDEVIAGLWDNRVFRGACWFLLCIAVIVGGVYQVLARQGYL